MAGHDVIVVGSGAAGSLLAAKLARGGKRVLVLEGGPERRLGDLVSSQLWARRLKWSGPWIQTGGRHPISVHFGQGWGTGGAALHHYGGWFRLHPEDFELASRFGRGLDWPFGYDELRPYYDRVQHEVGISGDAAQEIWRPPGDPYPMPPLPLFAQARLVARGFRALGLHTAPLPLAINSVPYGGRPACLAEGWCDAGCPLGALANPLAVFLPQARQAGAELRHESRVTRVLVDPAGQRVTGVECFDARGEQRVESAALVILAATPLENPRILLNSACTPHPRGLANSTGLVGKYMMTHAAGNVFGLFDEETENHKGVSGGQLLCQDAYAKDPKRGWLGSSQWLVANALKPNDLLGIANAKPELFGDELHAFLRRASHHLATMTFVGENLPDPRSELALGEKADRYGLPLARITHEFGADDLRGFEAGVRQGREIFEAAGAREVWTFGPVSMHSIGGTLMGRDPKRSVADGFGRAHDLPNLFLAGAGLFPTSGGVNPTFTLSALALRTADFVLARWRELV